MTNVRHIHDKEAGVVVPLLIIFIIVFMAIGGITLQLVTNNYKVAIGDNYSFQAQLATDSGADLSIQAVNDNPDWGGTGGVEQVIYSDANYKTTYTSTVTPGVDDKAPKTIDVTGRTYSPVTATAPKAERKIRVMLRGVGGGGTYSVVTGVGGLIMTNSAKITDGDVYVNGSLTMSNTSQIGSTTKPVNVRVANARCPLNTNDPTYPRLCTAGENDDPIKMNHSSRIYGIVQATYQYNGSQMSNPGLSPGFPPVAALPSHDRNAQKAAVTVTRGGGTTDAGCNSNGTTRTWAANTKIVGNVTANHKCVITVYGDVWITGNLFMDQMVVIKVAEGLTTAPVIMIDGAGGLNLDNSSLLKSNSAKIGFRIITYWSAAACGADCADVKGVDYQNSKGVNTIQIGNSGAGPNTEFYARWSAVTVGNSGDIGAVAGQTVNLVNSAAITFGAQVSNMDVPPTTWVVQSYRRMY